MTETGILIRNTFAGPRVGVKSLGLSALRSLELPHVVVHEVCPRKDHRSIDLMRRHSGACGMYIGDFKEPLTLAYASP
jgi:hypothetical protein